jgi:ring-1,2-phenylacetyl-CoA epoxidase subunit PaaD
LINNPHTESGKKFQKEDIIALLSEVCDPEIPVLTIMDLGVVRDVVISDDEVEVVITPTYSGCPAMDAISMDIRMRLMAAGISKLKINTVLNPAWTTEWMSEEGKRKLREYGIAPPPRLRDKENAPLACPRCGSVHTRTVSEFGSTACKSLCQCEDCLEFFDHFKCH